MLKSNQKWKESTNEWMKKSHRGETKWNVKEYPKNKRVTDIGLRNRRSLLMFVISRRKQNPTHTHTKQTNSISFGSFELVFRECQFTSDLHLWNELGLCPIHSSEHGIQIYQFNSFFFFSPLQFSQTVQVSHSAIDFIRSSVFRFWSVPREIIVIRILILSFEKKEREKKKNKLQK